MNVNMWIFNVRITNTECSNLHNLRVAACCVRYADFCQNCSKQYLYRLYRVRTFYTSLRYVFATDFHICSCILQSIFLSTVLCPQHRKSPTPCDHCHACLPSSPSLPSGPVRGLQLLVFVNHRPLRLSSHRRITASFKAIFLDQGHRQWTPVKERPIYRPHRAHRSSVHPQFLIICATFCAFVWLANVRLQLQIRTVARATHRISLSFVGYRRHQIIRRFGGILPESSMIKCSCRYLIALSTLLYSIVPSMFSFVK